MKNIIIFGYKYGFLDEISKSNKFNIVLNVVGNQEQKNECRLKYKEVVGHVTTDEIYNSKVDCFSYDDIKLFHSTQIASEHQLLRHSLNININSYIYYSALSFWKGFFEINKIDAILSYGTDVSEPYMKTAFDFAKKNNIKVFLMDLIGNNQFSKYSRAIKDYNNDSYVDLSKYSWDYEKIDMGDFFFNVGGVRKGAFEKKVKLDIYKYRYSGMGLLFQYLLSVFYPKKYDIKFPISITTRKKLFFDYLQVLKVKKCFKKLVNVNVDLSKKYILYSMHFEPEGQIMSRVEMNNQLFILKMISNNLPNDWNLLVRDHPQQFDIDNVKFWYYAINFYLFKSCQYYQEISNLPNTYLITTKGSSEKIVENAECIASINGTALTEAIVMNKPVLMFGHKSTPIGILDDVFKIRSSVDIKDALFEINNGFQPIYSDFKEVCNKYLFIQDKDHLPNPSYVLYEELLGIK
jgi:hypothetical protein